MFSQSLETRNADALPAQYAAIFGFIYILYYANFILLLFSVSDTRSEACGVFPRTHESRVAGAPPALRRIIFSRGPV